MLNGGRETCSCDRSWSMEAEAWLDIVALLRLPFRCCAACNLLLLVRFVSSVDPV